MSTSIFVSHSHNDEKLAHALVNLIETGIGVNSDEIFYTSLKGSVPLGGNFVDVIRSNIQEATIVIVLLTEKYWKSQFCLCEMGAAWALSHTIIPIVSPPLTYNDVKGVIANLEAVTINDQEKLATLYDCLVDKLDIKKPRTFAKWEQQRNQFIEIVNNIIKTEQGSYDSCNNIEMEQNESDYGVRLKKKN